MSEGDGDNSLREGRKQVREGFQKIFRGGIIKSQEKKKDISYYRRNRSEILGDLAFNFSRQKKPAAAGLIVLLPILVVSLIIAWLFSRIDFIPYSEMLDITDYYIINQSVKLASLLVLGTIIVTVTGKIVRTNIGFRIEKIVDSVIGRIPFLGAVYRISKITTETVIEGTEELSKPVKLEISDMKLTAFKTGNRTEEGRHILFLPTSPNITTGMILEVNPENIIDTDETAEEALTRILSAGFGQNLIEPDSKKEN